MRVRDKKGDVMNKRLVVLIAMVVGRFLIVVIGNALTVYTHYLGSKLEQNMVLDLRVPQNQRYQQIVLDTSLHRALSGESTREEAIV